jgi:hypothetical protein
MEEVRRQSAAEFEIAFIKGRKRRLRRQVLVGKITPAQIKLDML